MSDINDVIAYYHDLLTDEIAEATDEAMREDLKKRGLYFGNRPLSIVLRPHFYFEEDWNYLTQGLDTVLSAFARMHELCIEDDKCRGQLFLHDYEEVLYPLDVGGPPPWTSSRLDTFYVVEDRTLRCVEYNSETPAGIGYGDELFAVFDELEPMKRFRQRYHAHSMPGLSRLTDSIMAAYKQWGGKEQPQIAILDWQDVPTINEHVITKAHFERDGYKTILADPRHLEYKDGHLWAKDFRIDIIYKRVLYSELIERLTLDCDVVHAIRDRAVFITNSPSAKLLSKKASLAFLSDELNAHFFTPKQHKAINAHVPWTRLVRERKTLFYGETIDLLPYIAENKNRFVLKPNDEYGGKGVVIGWLADDDTWQETLKQAVDSPYVVQERVPIPERDYPAWIDGELNISGRFVDADPYVFNGAHVHACLTRLSPVELLNVTAGGGSVVPAYIISEK